MDITTKNIEVLKATDLMIGDWVQKPSFSNIESLRPGQIEIDDFLDEEEYGVISACEPIQLTEEILTKNFKYNENLCYDIFRNNDIGECLYYNLTYHTICYKPDKDSWACSMKDNEITYVHELQHFLKGIKYNKEIVL